MAATKKVTEVVEVKVVTIHSLIKNGEEIGPGTETTIDKKHAEYLAKQGFLKIIETNETPQEEGED